MSETDKSKQIKRLKDRLANQYPVVGDWIRRQALRSLERIGSAEAVTALYFEAMFTTDATMKHRVIKSLMRIALRPISSSTRAAVEAFQACTVTAEDSDGQLRRKGLIEIMRASDSWPTVEAQHDLCKLAMKTSDDELLQFLVQNKCSSPYPHIKTQFLFFTKQFDEAGVASCDPNDVNSAFGFGFSPDDRFFRIAQIAVDARRVDWADAAMRVADTLAEFQWEASIRIYLETRNEAVLWNAIARIPPIFAANVLEKLAERGWRPSSDQRKSFEKLLVLANAWPYRSHAITEPPVAIEAVLGIYCSKGDTLVFFCDESFVVCELTPSWPSTYVKLQTRQYCGRKIAEQTCFIGGPAPPLVVSGNGKWLLLGDSDGTVSIRELPSLQLMNSVRVLREPIHSITVSITFEFVEVHGHGKAAAVLALPSLKQVDSKAFQQVEDPDFANGLRSISHSRYSETSLRDSSKTALREDRSLTVTADRSLTVLSQFGIHLFRNRNLDGPYSDFVDVTRYLPSRDGTELRISRRTGSSWSASGIAWTPQGSLMALGARELFVIHIGLQHDSLEAWQKRIDEPIARMRIALRSTDLQPHEQRGLEFIQALWGISDGSQTKDTRSLAEQLVPVAARQLESRRESRSEDEYWSTLADIASILNDMMLVSLNDKEFAWHLNALAVHAVSLPLEVISTLIAHCHAIVKYQNTQFMEWFDNLSPSISVPAYLIWLCRKCEASRDQLPNLHLSAEVCAGAVETLDRVFVSRLIWFIANSDQFQNKNDAHSWWTDADAANFMAQLSESDAELFWQRMQKLGCFETVAEEEKRDWQLSLELVLRFAGEWVNRFPDAWNKTLLAASARERVELYRYSLNTFEIARDSRYLRIRDPASFFVVPKWISSTEPAIVRELFVRLFDFFSCEYEDSVTAFVCYSLNQMDAEWEAGFSLMTLEDLTGLISNIHYELSSAPSISSPVLLPSDLYTSDYYRCYDDRQLASLWIDPTELFVLIRKRISSLDSASQESVKKDLADAVAVWREKAGDDDNGWYEEYCAAFGEHKM